MLNTIGVTKPRQTAPEWSQSSYLKIKAEDVAPFEYVKKGLISNEERFDLLDMVRQLHTVKEYKPETFYKAVFVVDAYLDGLSRLGRSAPNLIHLGTIAILLAAKLEQPISPSFNRMIRLLPSSNQKTTSKK